METILNIITLVLFIYTIITFKYVFRYMNNKDEWKNNEEYISNNMKRFDMLFNSLNDKIKSIVREEFTDNIQRFNYDKEIRLEQYKSSQNGALSKIEELELKIKKIQLNAFISSNLQKFNIGDKVSYDSKNSHIVCSVEVKNYNKLNSDGTVSDAYKRVYTCNSLIHPELLPVILNEVDIK